MSTAEDLMASWREGIPEPVKRTPRAFACTPTPRREQYRRLEWEDAGGLECEDEREGWGDEESWNPEPPLHATVTPLPIPPEVLRPLEDSPPIPPEWMPHVEAAVARYHEPVKLPPDMPPHVVRFTLMAVRHMRHHSRMRPAVPGDHEGAEYAGAAADGLKAILRFWRELVLEDGGFRRAAHGIHPVTVDPETGLPDPATKWRVQLWADGLGPILGGVPKIASGPRVGQPADHLHVCYCDTFGEAVLKLAEWWVKKGPGRVLGERDTRPLAKRNPLVCSTPKPLSPARALERLWVQAELSALAGPLPEDRRQASEARHLTEEELEVIGVLVTWGRLRPMSVADIVKRVGTDWVKTWGGRAADEVAVALAGLVKRGIAKRLDGDPPKYVAVAQGSSQERE